MVLKTVSTLGGGGGGGGGGTPGGANSTIQFNNAGAFGGSANLTWDGGNVQIGSSGRIKLSNGTTNYVAFNAPAVIPANVTWTLPSTDGATGNFLITNGSGTLSWAAANLTPIAPTNYSLPEVSGTTTVGQTLSSTTGGWNGYPAPTYAYQWVRGVSNIGGATSATYPLVDADYNNTIKVIVTATNSAVSANATSNATATIAGTVPGAPTIGTATAGNAQASVAFTAPAVTGGPSITSYTATSSPGGITGSSASSPITVTGLTNGTAYTFTVTATNSIGTGPASAASNSVTPSAIVQDASFAYVPLLLETTSTNGQQNNTFLDSSTNNFTITRNGTPTQGSITPYWPNGQWSNYFNGSSYLSFTDASNLLDLGGAKASVEFWANPNNNSQTSIIFAKGGGSPDFNTSNGFEYQIQFTGGAFRFLYNISGSNGTLIDPTTRTANQWYHIALAVSVSNTVSLFVNGTRVATASSVTITKPTSRTLIRVALDFSSNYFSGYVSNLNFVTGANAYDATQTTITVPTSPLYPVSGTNLLTCQSNRFIDNSTNNFTITPNGTPRVQAFQPFSPTASYTTALYGGSGYFDGTSYLSVASNAALALGTGNFTIEFWIYPIVIPGAGVFTSIYVLGASLTNTMFINFRGSGTIGLTDGGSVYATTASPLVANNWCHIAVVRSSGSSRIYTNGVGGTAVACAADFAQNFVTIAYDSINAAFNGYLSNLRVVKGTAVYTANFTPPTAPVTAIANTSLLLNMTNAGIYDAAAQNVITTVGDAQASTTITAQWPPTSMKFDGTGDWLTAIDNPQLQLGTGDFTIEGWFYLTANGTAYGIVSKGAASTGWSVNVTSGNRIQFSYTAANLTGSTTTLAASTWYYFAVVRSGSATGNLKIYINGALEVTSGGAVTDNFNQTNILYVGASRTGTTPLNGYLQDIRITKAARSITASPAAPFPVQ